ncbi:MAG TPA: helix-hairpin-helix domain-containing protein, partial [bacterium]|nr:helix-hairpin-helix domain-containing protein [bacterium]
QMFTGKKFGTAKTASVVTQFDYTRDYSKVLNLNTATKTQLASITGISSGAAARIIEYRDKNNGFKSVDELLKVSGITLANFTEMQRYLYLPENEGKVNLNTATKTQLQTLSGVGSTLAQRIIDYRTATPGGFKDITDLKNITGISDGIYAGIKNSVTVIDGANTFLGEAYFSPKDKIEDKIINYINKAEYTIEFALFTFTEVDIANALIAAKNRGVVVRGIFEDAQINITGCQYTPLKNAGIKVIKDKNSYCMHHKYIIIDGRIVITGSFNWTASANVKNDENIVILKDKPTAIQYYEDFKKILAY